MNEKTEKTSLNSGDFRPDGSWNRAAEKSERGPIYAFIRGLIRIRNLSHASPAQMADNITASKWRWAFGELEQWSTLTRWDDWPFAQTRTSADAAVKYAGVGSVEHSHFEAGDYRSGQDQRPFVSADRHKVASFVYSLGARLSDPGSPKPVPGSQAKTGHYPDCTCEECFADAWDATKRSVGL